MTLDKKERLKAKQCPEATGAAEVGVNPGSLIRKGNFIKIGCLEEPKPTYPSLL